MALEPVPKTCGRCKAPTVVHFVGGESRLVGAAVIRCRCDECRGGVCAMGSLDQFNERLREFRQGQ